MARLPTNSPGSNSEPEYTATSSPTASTREDRIVREYRESGGVTVREFLERIMNERDSHYDTRFVTLEKRIYEALAAQANAATLAFATSEKAVLKAEEAQKDYNTRSNEFRGQLDDQAKTLMPRSETVLLIKGLDTRLETNTAALEKRIDAMLEEIKSLRESRSNLGGRSEYQHESRQQDNWKTGIIVIIAVALINILLHFWK